MSGSVRRLLDAFAAPGEAMSLDPCDRDRHTVMPDRRIRTDLSLRSDWEALAGDWQRVGQDLRRAIDRVIL